MKHQRIPGRRRAQSLVAALCMALGFTTVHAATLPRIYGGIAQVEVVDRAEGAQLPVYEHEGNRYVVGTPGHEYTVRIRNNSGARILVVTSVDGVNVVTGDTASPAQSGYVLDAWGSVEIAGWRKSRERIATFFFTEHANSYAARTGRPNDVGVIGVAVFQERKAPVAWFNRSSPQRAGQPLASGAPIMGAPTPPPLARESSDSLGRAESDRADASPPPARPAQSAGALAPSAETANDTLAAAKSMAKLGTGHGRSEESRVDFVRFERASETPAEVLALRYDRRENLAALGVIPQPQIARRSGSPNPFPADFRFAPDPTR